MTTARTDLAVPITVNSSSPVASYLRSAVVPEAGSGDTVLDAVSGESITLANPITWNSDGSVTDTVNHDNGVSYNPSIPTGFHRDTDAFAILLDYATTGGSQSGNGNLFSIGKNTGSYDSITAYRQQFGNTLWFNIYSAYGATTLKVPTSYYTSQARMAVVLLWYPSTQEAELYVDGTLITTVSPGSEGNTNAYAYYTFGVGEEGDKFWQFQFLTKSGADFTTAEIDAMLNDPYGVFETASTGGTTISPVNETDQAIAGSYAKSFSTNPVAEITSTPSPTLSKSQVPAAVTETDAAIAPALVIAYVGQPVGETNQPIAPITGKTLIAAPASESDTAIAAQTAYRYTASPVIETDQPVDYQSGSSFTAQPVSETDQLVQPVLTKSWAANPVSETDATPQARFAKQFIAAVVEEIDTPISPATPHAFVGQPVSETDSLPAIRSALVYRPSPESELDTAIAAVTALRLTGHPVKSSETPVLGLYSRVGLVGPVLELDQAIQFISGNEFVIRPDLIQVQSATPTYAVRSVTPVYSVSK